MTGARPHDRFDDLLITRCSQPLWSVPYPQELNDIPAIVVGRPDRLRRALQHIAAHRADLWITTPGAIAAAAAQAAP